MRRLIFSSFRVANFLGRLVRSGGRQDSVTAAVILQCLTLLFSLSFFALMPCLTAPAEAKMQDDQAEIRYLLAKRFMLWGEVALEYDRTTTKTGDSAAFSRYSFDQSVRLNFKSYIVHPALVTYTAEVDWLHGSGDYSRGNAKTVALNFDFLRTRPLNFSLGARYTKEDDYTLNQQSLSINYFRPRKELVFNSMRAASMYAAMQQRANAKNNNQDSGDDSNDNDDANSNNNSGSKKSGGNNNSGNSNNSGNNNSSNNNRGNLNNLMKPESRNVLDLVMPLFAHFDVQRDEVKADFGPSRNTETYSSSLRFAGQVPLSTAVTDYNLNFDYYNANEKGGSERDKTRYDTSFDFKTHFKSGAQLRFDSKYDINDYGAYKFNNLYVRSTYEGFFADKLWDYRIIAAYNRAGVDAADGTNKSDYGTALMADAGSSRRFGRLQSTYRFGLKYEENGDTNYAVFANATAGMPMNDKLHLSLRANADIGSRQRLFGLDLNSRYTLSKMASLIASYTFADSSGSFVSGNRLFGGAPLANYTSHMFRVGLQVVKNNVSFDSTAQYNLYTGGHALSWDNVLNTNLFNRISLTFGASITRQKGAVGVPGSFADNWSSSLMDRTLFDNGENTYVRFYNIVAASPYKNVFLRVYSTYSRRLDGDNKNANYSVNPVIAWRLRKLYMNLEYLHTVDYPEKIRHREDRIILKVSRPFWQ